MSSQPVDAPMSFPPQTFSSLLNSSGAASQPQAAFHQHFQHMHAMMMASRQQQQQQQQQNIQQQQQQQNIQQQQQQQQQHPVPSALEHMKAWAQPASFPLPGFPFGFPPLVQQSGGAENGARSAAGDALMAAASMRGFPVPMHHMGAWQQMGGGLPAASPHMEGMLRSWSQGLLAAAGKSADSSAAHMPQRKQKRPPGVAAADKKPKRPGADAAQKAGFAAADDGAEGSALDVLSAAVDVQDGDRDEASLKAANALQDMLGGWNGGEAAIPGMFAPQPLTPRSSKKRSRSLLKDLAVNVGDNADDDGMELTPCSKGRSSKQLDSAYNHTTNPEHVCRTKHGAPVVDVHVPAMCECGSVVVGVWYRNRPHYCRWFRHQRYAPLRALLEQNRRKNKSRPADEKGACDGPAAAANESSLPSEAPASACSDEPVAAAPADSSLGCGGEHEVWGSKTSTEELLAPKFLSLLCLFQFVKHDDAVELVYPRGILGNTMTKPVSLKISAHIDCERSKGFVQYRWYSTELVPLIDDLSASDAENKRVVGCCCLGHWKRKPPGRESSKTTSHLLVSSAIDIENVLSPFEIDGSVDAVISLTNPVPNSPFGTPQKTVVISGAASWEALDESIWATATSLTLLPDDVLSVSKGKTFSPLAQTARSSKCSNLCENTLMTPKHDFRHVQSPRHSVANSTPGTAASSSPAPRPCVSSFSMLKEEPVSPKLSTVAEAAVETSPMPEISDQS